MKRIALLSLASMFAWQFPQLTMAVTPGKANAGEPTVKQILTLELSKDASNVNRRELLHPTTHPKTASDAEWWQAGFVRIGDVWQAAEKLPPNGSLAIMDRYRAERAAASLTASGQLKLADWCRDSHLPDQERAHLLQSLMRADKSFDRTAIYRRMGYQRVGDQWISVAEVRQSKMQGRRREAELRAWQPAVGRIARNWGTGAKQHKLAKDELAGIHDKSAIPALTVAAGSGEPLALAICDQLKEMDCFESSQALASISVQAEWPLVRRRAIEHLKKRRIDDFASALLSQMHCPLVSSEATLGTNAPKLVFREDADRYIAVDISVVTVMYQMTTILGHGTAVSGLSPSNQPVGAEFPLAKHEKARFLEDLDFNLQTRIDAENDRVEEYNKRAGLVLAELSGQESSSDPRYWWTWWHLHSATEPLPKQHELSSQEIQVPTVLHVVTSVVSSCLVAGTPVRTDQGFVAIDQIKVGDLVLAKDVSTGEIAFKPVLHTTVRRPVTVKSFVVADTKITASDGHHFWISGDGWKKTRELSKVQPVHTAMGMSRIESVNAEPDLAPVYNLVVADFHTYFVGSAMILSHDVLPPSPTNVKVPGLEVEVASKSF